MTEFGKSHDVISVCYHTVSIDIGVSHHRHYCQHYLKMRNQQIPKFSSNWKMALLTDSVSHNRVTLGEGSVRMMTRAARLLQNNNGMCILQKSSRERKMTVMLSHTYSPPNDLCIVHRMTASSPTTTGRAAALFINLLLIAMMQQVELLRRRQICNIDERSRLINDTPHSHKNSTQACYNSWLLLRTSGHTAIARSSRLSQSAIALPFEGQLGEQ